MDSLKLNITFLVKSYHKFYKVLMVTNIIIFRYLYEDQKIRLNIFILKKLFKFIIFKIIFKPGAGFLTKCKESKIKNKSQSI